MSGRTRVVVVGAGIGGLSVAHACVRRGIETTVVAAGSGATAAGAGLQSGAFARAVRPLAAESRAIVEALVPARRFAMAQVALSRESARALRALAGVRDGLPDALERALAPAFLARVFAALHAPDDVVLDGLALLGALGRGAVRVETRAIRVRRDGVETTRGFLAADAVVVATGAGAPLRGAPRLDVDLRRAETAFVSVALPCAFHVVDTGLYARPEGRAAVAGDGDAPWRGARPERVAPTARVVSRIAREMGEALGRPVRATPRSAGVLAFSRGGRPFSLVRAGNVVSVGGFGGDGLALAPAVGERVADLLFGRRVRPRPTNS